MAAEQLAERLGILQGGGDDSRIVELLRGRTHHSRRNHGPVCPFMGAASLSKVLTPSSIPMDAPRLQPGERRVGEAAFPGTTTCARAK
ncbi:hypothetical protein GCM10023194_42350 [Planotetraspora phitsanulokensis]